MPELNRHIDLGKIKGYHYINTAQINNTHSANLLQGLVSCQTKSTELFLYLLLLLSNNQKLSRLYRCLVVTQLFAVTITYDFNRPTGIIRVTDGIPDNSLLPLFHADYGFLSVFGTYIGQARRSTLTLPYRMHIIKIGGRSWTQTNIYYLLGGRQEQSLSYYTNSNCIN